MSTFLPTKDMMVTSLSPSLLGVIHISYTYICAIERLRIGAITKVITSMDVEIVLLFIDLNSKSKDQYVNSCKHDNNAMHTRLWIQPWKSL